MELLRCRMTSELVHLWAEADKLRMRCCDDSEGVCMSDTMVLSMNLFYAL